MVLHSFKLTGSKGVNFWIMQNERCGDAVGVIEPEISSAIFRDLRVEIPLSRSTMSTLSAWLMSVTLCDALFTSVAMELPADVTDTRSHLDRIHFPKDAVRVEVRFRCYVDLIGRPTIRISSLGSPRFSYKFHFQRPYYSRWPEPKDRCTLMELRKILNLMYPDDYLSGETWFS